MGFALTKRDRLWKQCDREIARARRLMENRPDLFTPSLRSEIEAAASRLDLTRRNETNLRLVAAEIKNFKRVVDRAVPVWRGSVVREYVEAIGIALLLALFIRTFMIQAFKIPSGSMIPTLLIGDHLIVNKAVYGFEIPFTYRKFLPYRTPKRGEIIVFRYPNDPTKDYIKRVVGIPGDRIEMRQKRLYINGEEIPLERLGPAPEFDAVLYEENLDGHKHKVLFSNPSPSLGDNFSVVVPENKYFCMGDNRDRSNDSRIWGFVDFHFIRGKAMII